MTGSGIKISEVEIRLLDRPDKGLVAWASCVVNDTLFLSNIAVRRTRQGRMILCFPCRKSGTDLAYHYFRPVSCKGMQVFREAIFKEYDIAESNRG